MSAARKDNRKADLAKIHIAKKELGMDEETYQNMLWTVALVKSSGVLSYEGRQKVLAHLQQLGWKPKPGRPKVLGLAKKLAEDKRRLGWRIEQWLLAAKPSRDESYVLAMIKNMFHVERLEFCTAEQLHSVVAALEIDGKRHGWRIDKGAKREQKRT